MFVTILLETVSSFKNKRRKYSWLKYYSLNSFITFHYIKLQFPKYAGGVVLLLYMCPESWQLFCINTWFRCSVFKVEKRELLSSPKTRGGECWIKPLTNMMDPKSNDMHQNPFCIRSPPAEHYIAEPLFSEYLLLFDNPDVTLNLSSFLNRSFFL